MKTRALAAVLTLTMILSACSGGRAAALAEETAAFYAGLTRFSAEAEVQQMSLAALTAAVEFT